ncbi:AMP-binding protein [Nocardioides ganghwensis]|uniref:AMP-dependent synthetase n=1 Tax=Nocardioides ganghwensis TaxID=252230 RepID=A0A4Q2SA49_9ACTN|nr:AMP-binding protein [Nocardioides ganghwensis]MBD3945708.1 AMP-binding protein [Nocardioides ganghwensis]RYC01114.1 AMP-dependent synthetase [Nocardioides ganghwensis]
MTLTSPQPALAPRTPTRVGPVLDHARFGDAPAVVADGTVLSHADLARRVADRAATWGPARRLVLVEGANDLDSLVAYLAALQHGHVALVVPDGRPDQRDATVAAYDPDVVCTAAAPDDVRRPLSAHELHPDLALLLSTSGTTGSPKLVRLSRANVASNAAAIADYLALTPTDRAITALPLHYCYGLSVLHSHLVAGASVALTDLSVVDECFWDLFSRTGATTLAGVPHTFDLLAASGFEARDLPTLRQVTQAGGRLAPDDVRRWSRLGRTRGWDLVVMYGATEATARMAWLPPHLAEDHPGAIGVAIPGGHLHLDEAADDRPGVGELVYSGPNVMLGYATTPADLALGRVTTELRTGDLAQQRDGLFEVVGRRSRRGKVFGLRIDLDAVEQRLRAEVDPRARVVATDHAVHAFVTSGRGSGAARTLVADHCGVPPHAVRVTVVPQVPHTSSGKPDYAALAELAAPAEEQAGQPGTGSVRADFVRVLGRPDAADTDSFVDLGGDSLSYVELSTRLAAHFPGGLPAGWHTRAIGDLERLAQDGAADGDRGPERRSRLDTTVGLRALAILFVVASHVDLVALEGGAHLLLALAGFNFARFQLSAAGDARTRLRHGLSGIAQLLVPSVLWVGGVALLLGTYDLTTVLFVREVVNGSEWDDQWQLWFLESLVWLTVAALAVTTLPVLHRLERRTPFRFALGVLAVATLARLAEVGWRAGATERYTILVVAFFFALGWAGARATTTRERWLVTTLAVVMTVGFFGQPHREVIVLGGFLLMLWVPHLAVPAPLARAAGVLAGASLFVYLTHWQVYPPLEDAGHQWLALVASLTVGIAYARVVRPVHQAVGRAVLRAR